MSIRVTDVLEAYEDLLDAREEEKVEDYYVREFELAYADLDPEELSEVYDKVKEIVKEDARWQEFLDLMEV